MATPPRPPKAPTTPKEASSKSMPRGLRPPMPPPAPPPPPKPPRFARVRGLAAKAPKAGLSGTVKVPGDKSISHRALMMGALADGTTEIEGLLESADVLATAACVRALGATVERSTDGIWAVTGTEWTDPDGVLDCGNAGTAVRLLMGAVAGQRVSATFDGDRSLRSRPMDRILEPLSEMGVAADHQDGKLPVRLEAGAEAPFPIRYRLPKPSAQIKSAVLLAALGAEGRTVIEEPIASRDHTEKMLPAFGVAITVSPMATGGTLIGLEGPAKLKATHVTVPADPSSAAFPIVASLIVPGSSVTCEGVMMNRHRTGLFSVLDRMGAALEMTATRQRGGEEVADITARFNGPLKPIHLPAEEAPSLIDEYPILAVAAARADGTSRFEGLSELRVKESDRLAATAALLTAAGVLVQAGEDWLEVTGAGKGPIPGGGTVTTHDDHRIAMATLVLGLTTEAPMQIDDGRMIDTSFPGFAGLMNGLGATIGAH